MIEGMLANGYQRDFAERCFGQIEGFGEYGFPESHAASFALLVYASAWLKCHYPDVFAAALLNAQPMGFYAPAQIVRDLREHGVEVRPPDVNFSDWDSTLEPGPRAAERLHGLHREMHADVRATHAVRLGLREIKGLSEEDARLIVARRTSPLPHARFLHLPRLRGRSTRRSASRVGEARSDAAERPPPQPSPAARGASQRAGRGIAYDSLRDLWLRTGLSPRVIERLADADAFGSLGLSRRDALWAVKALGRSGDHEDLPLFRTPAARREPDVALIPMPPGEEVVNDYRFLKLSLRAHPASFLRGDLARRHVVKNETLRTARNGAWVRVSGLITIRQRPGTAKGVIFMTIEDDDIGDGALVLDGHEDHALGGARALADGDQARHATRRAVARGAQRFVLDDVPAREVGAQERRRMRAQRQFEEAVVVDDFFARRHRDQCDVGLAMVAACGTAADPHGRRCDRAPSPPRARRGATARASRKHRRRPAAPSRAATGPCAATHRAGVVGMPHRAPSPLRGGLGRGGAVGPHPRVRWKTHL